MIICSYLNYIIIFSLSVLLSKYVSCQIMESPRLVSKDGNLIIYPAYNKNITLGIYGDQSCINIGSNNLLHVVQAAKNASNLVQRLTSSMLTGRSPIITNLLLQVHGILDRIHNLERVGTNSTTNSRLARLFPKFIALRRKVNSLNTQVAGLLSAMHRESCSSNPCKNGATCLENMKGFHCICSNGWDGTTCNIDVNECSILGHTSLGCQNGATCVNTPGSFECQCAVGWYGVHCTASSMSDCTSSTTEELCGHGTCIPQSSNAGIKCICDQGWKTNGISPACKEDINECEGNHHPCSVNPFVPCVNVPGSFHCGSCPIGYHGNGYYCVDVDECLINNGGCSIAPSVQCINTLGSRTCGDCPPGYSGDGITCLFVGICHVNNGGCHPLADCFGNSMISSTYVQCRCKAGYTGTGYGINGCRPIIAGASTPPPSGFTSNHCVPNPCLHGMCHDIPEGYLCICESRYTGINCDQLRNPCSPNPCVNGGSCISNMITMSYRCECTSQYTGSTCESHVSTCGGVLEAQEGSIVYPETNITAYNHNSKCGWVILTAPDKVLNITFTRFNLEQAVECLYDWLQIHDGRNSASHNIGRYCGNHLPNGGNIISTQNVLYLWFRSDHTINGDGFSLHWTSIDPICGDIQNANYGIIKSPGSPGKYPPNRDCYWKINAPIDKRIQIHFFTMQIEEQVDCNADFVIIHDGPTVDDNVLGRYCNTSHPPPLLTSGPQALVHFHSDATHNDYGFQLSYAVVDGIPGCGINYMQNRGEITPPKRNGEYVSNVFCEYKIQLPIGTKIKLNFLSFDLEESSVCNFDYLAIYDGDSQLSPLIGKYCGTTIPPNIVSSTNNLMIVFRSDYTITADGFRIEFEIVCHEVLTNRDGLLKSPGYPKVYPHDRKCTYEISLPVGKAIHLSFIDFDIEEISYPACTYDNVKVFDGDNENATLIGTYCGRSEFKPADIVSTHNYLYIEFNTDGSVSGTGFVANYTTIDKECGGILKDISGTIEYPNTRKNPLYSNLMKCTWVLSAPPGFVIQITWMTFDLESLNNCYGDYVEIFDNNTVTRKSEFLGRYCGNTLPPALTSLTNMLTIIFQSDESLVSNGFSMSYIFSDVRKVCGGTFMSSHGEIISPGWPDMYPPKKDCKWTIKVPQGQQIMLNITKFELETHSYCFGDYLEIRNGGYENAPLVGKYCGTDIPKTIPSMTNALFLHFHSDISRVFSGFQITWDSTSTGCGGILTSSRGSIISPNYPQKYGHNAECYWKISTSAGSVIELVFADIDLEIQGRCVFDYVEIFDGTSGSTGSLGRFCTLLRIPGSIISKTNNVFIKFRSDGYNAGHGFIINYNTVCNRNLTSNTGVIESPNFPSPYPDYTDCTWRIIVPKGNQINVTFSHLELLKRYRSFLSDLHGTPRITINLSTLLKKLKITDASCQFDYVQLKDGKDVNYTNNFCGNDLPPPYRSSDNNVFVHFHSDNSHHQSGFRLEWVIDGCGGTLKRPAGIITSPGYPKFYVDDKDCEWIIETDFGKSIELSITDIDMEMRENCQFDSLQVYNGPNGDSQQLLQICHSHKEDHSIVTSTGNFMFIKFVTDSSYSGRGFSASYKTIPSKCGGKFKSVSGIITSPNYPNNYDNNMECFWLIEVPNSHLINLTFIDFDLAKFWTTNCSDVVNIYDGSTPDKNLLMSSFCGNIMSGPGNFSSTTNKLLIEFRSDSRDASKGFKAKYSMACGARIVAQTEGFINTHTGLTTIEDTENCTWTIIGERPDQKVYLTITHMDILINDQDDVYENCTEQYIEIFNGDSINAPSMGKLCDTNVPPTIVSFGNALTVLLRSPYRHKGFFAMHYSVLSTACGGELTSEKGSFTSPQYPDSYPVNRDCFWTIATSPGNKVVLTFTQFNLESSENCNEDYVEVRENDAVGNILGTFCGDAVPVNTSIASKLWIKFHSDGDGVGSGFVAFYSYEYHNEIVGLTEGQLTSPLYPRVYVQDAEFTWRITVDFGGYIILTFKEFQIDKFSTEDCYISLKFFDGYDDTAPMLLEACGNELPEPVKTTSNLVYIKLGTEAFAKGTLFLIDWIRVALEEKETVFSKEICGSQGNTFVPISSSRDLISPGYPYGYKHNLHCEWIFETDPSHHLMFKFTDIFLEESDSCFMDKVSLYSGQKGSEEWKLIINACLSNSTDLPDIQSTNLLKVVFDTDISGNQTGFAAYIYSQCGGSLTSFPGTISPSYQNKSMSIFYRGIKQIVDCQWNVSVRPGRTIKLEFENLNITNRDPSICSNYIMLRNGESAHSPLLGIGKYCGSTIPADNLTTTGNHAYINYHSFQSVPFQAAIQGFVLKYSELSRECGTRIKLSKEDNSTLISSPNYPNIPHPHTECIWTILTSPGERIRLDFIERFDLAPFQGCPNEYVEVRDGGTMYSNVIGRYCQKSPGTIRSTSNVMFIRFFTDVTDPRNGFKAKISIDSCGGTVYGKTGFIHSPNTLALSVLQTDVECEWRIIGPESHSLWISLVNMWLPISDSCNLVSLQLFDIVPFNKTALPITKKICGKNESLALQTSSNEAVIVLTMKRGGMKNNLQGFSLTFNSTRESCGGKLTSPSGYLEGQKFQYSGLYSHFCEWKITVPVGRRIKVEILQGYENASSVYNQRIGFYNGHYYGSLIRFLFLNDKTNIVESSSNKMLVYYFSRMNPGLKQFRARYTSDDPSVCEGRLAGNEGSISPPIPIQNMTTYYCEYSYEPLEDEPFVGKTLALTFKDLVIGEKNSYLCRFSTSRITVTAESIGILMDLCGNYTKPVIILSPISRTTLKIIQTYKVINFHLDYKVHSCGGIVQNFEDPNLLKLPANYTGTLDCAWSIITEPGKTFQISSGQTVFSSQSCDNEYLTIKNGRFPSSALMTKMCYSKSPPETLHSQGRYIWVEYHSDNYSSSTHLDIKIETDALGCGGILTNLTRVFHSPNFPKSYGENQECSWEIHADVGYKITLSFEQRFFLEDSNNCTKDFIEIFDYVAGEWISLDKRCGRIKPGNYFSSSDRMKVLFRSDLSVNGDGFQARWNTFCGGTYEVTETPNLLRSPGFPVYGRNLSCIYIFKAEENKYINLNFTRFSLESGTIQRCQYDNVTLDQDSSDMLYEYDRVTKQLYCGTQSPGNVRFRNSVTLKFFTDLWIQKPGFQLFYSIDSCGAVINSSQRIHSPHDNKMKYHKHVDCIWNITAPENKIVALRFRSFVLEHSSDCGFDSLSVYEGNAVDPSRLLANLCGDLTNFLPVITSKGNKMIVKFTSDGSTEMDGFSADVILSYGEAFGCGGHIQVSNTSQPLNLFSQSQYEPFLECQWVVKAPVDNIIEMKFSAFNVSECFSTNQTVARRNNCACDFLELRDGAGFHSPLIGRYCGDTVPGDITSTSNILWIRFKSDGTLSSSGVRSTLSALRSPCGQTHLQATNQTKELISPGYTQGSVQKGIRCKWFITSLTEVHVKIIDLDLEPPSVTGHCVSEQLQISNLKNHFITDSESNFVISGYNVGIMPYFMGYSKFFEYSYCGKMKTLNIFALSSELAIILTTSFDGINHRGFKLEYSSPGCSRNFSEPYGRIKNYDMEDTSCVVMITVPANNTISLYMLAAAVIGMDCVNNYIEIRDGISSSSPVISKICGSEDPMPVFSSGNSLKITALHETQYMYLSYDMFYTSTDKGKGCGGTMFDQEGIIYSPMYPNAYRLNIVCEWIIRTSYGRKLELSFKVFNIGSAALCNTDYIELIDEKEKLIAKYCPGDNPAAHSCSNYVKLVQHSSINNNGFGWIAQYKSVEDDTRDPVN